MLKSVLVIAASIQISCAKNTNTASPDEEGNTFKPDMVVAADGSGDFRTLQEAVNAAPGGRTAYFYIYIKKGTYKEVVTVPKTKEYLYLLGEDENETVLAFDNYAKRLRPDGTEYGTGGSSTFFVNGNFFVAENLTISNTAGIDAGQAVAINIGAARSSFLNCRFLGHQDTWYAGNSTVQYLKECYIEGSVDFIFGGSTAFFDNCQIVSTRNGYITAASTPLGQSFGYVFNKCRLTAVPQVKSGSVYLGRPWRPNAQVVYLECDLGKHIHKAGWHNWNNADNEKTAHYAEYKSMGDGASPTTRVPWSRQLTAAQAAGYSKDKVTGTRHPEFRKEK